jgi:hypothetical protein
LGGLAQALQWAEDQAQHQRRLFRRRIGRPRDTIYGFEFQKLAKRDEQHYRKRCLVTHPNGGWVTLLDREIIKGVVFCKGLGEVIVCNSQNICPYCQNAPQRRHCLAAVVSCLEHLKRHDSLPPSSSWNFEPTAFQPCSNCPSIDHRIQRMNNNGPSPTTVPSTAYQKGVVLFGD